MSEDKGLKLDIKKNQWPKYKSVLTDLSIHTPFAKFEEKEDICGDIPERIRKERESFGIVGKGTNKFHLGKP
jgi:ribosome-binding protein aMBF1 (putative translation factor)